MTTALAEAPKEKPQLAMRGGWMQPSNMEEAYRLATAIVKSGLAPRSFQTPEAVLIAIQLGGELGLKPMQALQTIMVVNGRPALWGNGLQGLVQGSGLLEDSKEWFEGEGEDYVAICEVIRKGMKSPKRGTFSIADARRAGLMSKDLYNKYPADMLMSKARARAYKLFSDVLCGLPVAEDIQDVAVEVSPAPAAPTTPDPLLKKAIAAPVIDVTPVVADEEVAGSTPAVAGDTAPSATAARLNGGDSGSNPDGGITPVAQRQSTPKTSRAKKAETPVEPAPAPAAPKEERDHYDGVIAKCVETSTGLFKATTTDNDVFYTKNAQVAGFLSRSAKDKLPVGIDFVVASDGRWMIEQCKAL